MSRPTGPSVFDAMAEMFNAIRIDPIDPRAMRRERRVRRRELLRMTRRRRQVQR